MPIDLTPASAPGAAHRPSSGHAEQRHRDEHEPPPWVLRFTAVESRHQVLIGSLLKLTGTQVTSRWTISDHGAPDALVIGLHSEEGRRACEANRLSARGLPALLLGTPDQAAGCMGPDPGSMQLLSPPIRHQALFHSLDALARQCAELRAARSQAKEEAQPLRLRALVVDDSQTVRAQLSNVIGRIGMQCDTADSATAALARLEARPYDLIVVDVVMPEMDGYKLTREIKRGKAHKLTPVIILTSQASPFDRARGALAGCDIYLTKPVSLKAFYEAATRALRKSLAVDDLSLWLTEPGATRPAELGDSEPTHHDVSHGTAQVKLQTR